MFENPGDGQVGGLLITSRWARPRQVARALLTRLGWIVLAGCVITHAVRAEGPEVAPGHGQQQKLEAASESRSDHVGTTFKVVLNHSDSPQGLCLKDDASLARTDYTSPHNFDFEDWQGNVPLRWNVQGSHAQYVSRVQDEPYEGCSSLRLSGGYRYANVSQAVPIAFAPGEVLLVRAAAKAMEPATTFIALKTARGIVAVSEHHPGDGLWHVLEAAYRYPADFQDATIDVALNHSNDPKQACLFDDVFIGRPMYRSRFNLSFEEWAANIPLRWEVRPGLQRYVTRETDPEGKGSYVLKTEGSYNYTFIAQEISGFGPLPGKQIRLRVRVKCAEPQKATISIRLYDFFDFHSGYHPGDGQWHELEVSCRVPAFYPYDAFIVSMGQGGDPKGPCFFDDVTVTVEPLSSADASPGVSTDLPAK